jgi:hypothetical protein
VSSRTLNRRSFFTRIAGAGIAGAGALTAFQPRWAWATDNDPTDPVRGGGGSRPAFTDRDANDVAGQGRGNHSGRYMGDANRGRGFSTAPRPSSDQDPTDAAGHAGGADNRPVSRTCRVYTHITDADGEDHAGCGRGGNYEGRYYRPPHPPGQGATTGGVTDHDPSDTPGNGRGSVH